MIFEKEKQMDIYANYKTFKTEFAGRPLVVETGKFAGLANGSCMIRYGDTCVLATATASAKPRDGIDFFPLAVDYEEKLYSVGKIPGGFLKREGKPSEKAILTSRVIDRPIRPLFPKDMRNDVVISTTPMAVNNDFSPEITAMNGASITIFETVGFRRSFLMILNITVLLLQHSRRRRRSGLSPGHISIHNST